jgi:hypothetical protein
VPYNKNITILPANNNRTMKINLYSVLPLLFLFTASTGARAQVKKNLQPVFNANEQFEFKKTISIEVFDGKQPTSKQLERITLALSIIGKDATGKVMMRAQYKSRSGRTEDATKKEVTGYDSDAPEEFVKASNVEELRNANQNFKEFNGALLNKPFTIYVNERSGSVEVTGIDSLVTEALKDVSASNAIYLEGFSKGIRSVFNNEALTATLEAAFNYLPGKLVGTGDGWTKSIKEMETNLKLGYIVKSVQPDSIGIQVVAGPVVNNEYKVTVGKKGNITIDTKTGVLMRYAVRSEVKSVPGSGGNYLATSTEQYELVRIKQ